jgi:hypothetical protein
MTLLRAVFWIGVMVLLAPRDPGLGFAPVHASHAPQGAACTAKLDTCMHEQASVASLRELFFARLEQVKRDLTAKR